MVEKPKQRKKRESNSAAQLETLRKGREALALKRKQESEMKTKNTEHIDIEKKHDDYINKLNETYKKINDDLNSLVSRINIPSEPNGSLDPSIIRPMNTGGAAAPCAVPPKRPIMFV